MRLNTALLLCKSFINVKIRKKRSPIFVNWALTYRCNIRCGYCGIWKKECAELSCEQSFSLIDELYSLGCRVISFTGGEPLIREDIGKIVTYAKKKGIFVKLNTNGTLIKERINYIKMADIINFSLDGPEGVQDLLRGKGYYPMLIDAIKLVYNLHIPINLTAVLNRYNLTWAYIEHILKIADKFKAKILFQPATADLYMDTEPNPTAVSSSIQDSYRDIIDRLIAEKQRKNCILNSVRGLRHLRHWPYHTYIPCAAGLFYCRIEPDGNVSMCNRKSPQSYHRYTKGSFKESFYKLCLDDCGCCWCHNLVEFNYLFSLKADVIANFIGNYIKA